MGCDLAVVKANFMAMVHQARAVKIKVIIGAETAAAPSRVQDKWWEIGNFEIVNQRIEAMSKWLNQFCRTFEVPFVNLYQQFGEVIRDREDEYYLDGVHPNRKGHQKVAEIILQCGGL